MDTFDALMAVLKADPSTARWDLLGVGADTDDSRRQFVASVLELFPWGEILGPAEVDTGIPERGVFALVEVLRRVSSFSSVEAWPLVAHSLGARRADVRTAALKIVGA